MPRLPALSLLAALALAACSDSTDSSNANTAQAALRDQSARSIGTATLTELSDGTVQVDVSVQHLAPGNHGIHVHGVGVCDAGAGFGSAGTHFNPTSKQHGLDNPNGAHGGDLPNLVVGADSSGALHTTTRRLTLTTGALNALDTDGAAIVIHAAPDDQVTDPYGNSGARVVCGVLQRNVSG